MITAAVVEQHASHNSCCNPEKLVPILPLDPVLIDQPKISLVHQGGRLQGVIATLLLHVVTGEAPQFRIQQGRPFIWGQSFTLVVVGKTFCVSG